MNLNQYMDWLWINVLIVMVCAVIVGVGIIAWIILEAVYADKDTELKDPPSLTHVDPPLEIPDSPNEPFGGSLFRFRKKKSRHTIRHL